MGFDREDFYTFLTDSWWKIYGCVFLVVVLFGLLFELVFITALYETVRLPYFPLRAMISLVGIAPIFLLAFRKRFSRRILWQVYFYIALIQGILVFVVSLGRFPFWPVFIETLLRAPSYFAFYEYGFVSEEIWGS